MEHIVSPKTLDRFVAFLSFMDGCDRGAGDMIRHFHEYLEHSDCKEPCPDCELAPSR
jgi:hypothetical protein